MDAVLVGDLAPYICPVCFDIFENPVNINCGNGHVFCFRCVTRCTQFQSRHSCPVCRLPFDLNSLVRAVEIETFIKSHSSLCQGCQRKFPLEGIKYHESKCRDLQLKQMECAKSLNHGTPNSQVPNRFTFKCPYCPLEHLDQDALVKHCNQTHYNERSQVVCPICSSMPWGDPNYRSSNFVQHLNTRHRFEYDTYVDFQQDDDAMMAAAIEASMKEK